MMKVQKGSFIGKLLFCIIAIQWRIALAGPALEACVTVDEQFNASLPCAEYNNKYYKANLNSVNNPENSSELYWILGNYNETEFINGCGYLDQNLHLTLPCVTVENSNYRVTLKFQGPDLAWSLGKVNSFAISSLKPSVAISGEEIILNGGGFDPTSQIIFDGKTLQTKYVSDTELRGIIPFSKNEVNELIPYPSGIYEIKVDNGNAVNLTIKDLPENTQASGTVLTENISLLKNSFKLNAPAYLSNLQAQLNFYQNDPETQQFIKGFAELINMLDALNIDAELDKLQNLSDKTTISTLERTLNTSNNNFSLKKVFNIENSNHKLFAATTSENNSLPTCGHLVNGDEWLFCRASAIPLANTLSKITTVTSICSSFYPPCMAGVLFATITNLLNQIEITKQIGLIKKVNLNISGTETDNLIDQNKRTIPLFIDNYDNNENVEKQTVNAKNITAANIFISHEANWFSIINELRGLVTSLTGIGAINDKLDPLIDKILEITARNLDKSINEDFIQKEISNASLEEAKQQLAFSTIYDGGECNLNDFGGFHLRTTPEKKWIVPDIGPVSKPYTYQGTCRYGLKEDLFFPWESEVGSIVDFYTARFPKLFSTITSGGNIKLFYGNTIPKSQNTECNEALSPCQEYFSSINHLQLTSNSNAMYWLGIGADGCSDGSTCEIALDQTNNNPPSVTVHSYSGIWDVDASDNEIDCGEGINSYKLFPIIGVNGNELSISLRPVVWSGSLLTNPNSFVFNMSFSEDEGTTSESGLINFNKGTFAGSSSWSWSDGSDSCSGTSTFTGSKN